MLEAQHFAYLDSLYGKKGQLNIQMTKDWGVADALVVQADGKIILGGWVGNLRYIGLIRLLPDGSPDPSFGNRGKVILPLSTVGTGFSKITLALQKNGMIWVAGAGLTPDFSLNLTTPFDYVSDYNKDDFFHRIDHSGITFDDHGGKKLEVLLTRLLPNGQVDPKFGRNGLRIIPVQDDASLSDMAMDAKGNLFLCGTFESWFKRKRGATSRRVFVLKLDKKGRLDGKFGLGGRFQTDSSDYDFNPKLRLGEKGEVYFSAFSASQIEVWALDKNGKAKPNFGSNGRAIKSVSTQGSVEILPTPDGLLIGCSAYNASICFRKLSHEGVWDDYFHGNGYIHLLVNHKPLLLGASQALRGGFYLCGTAKTEKNYDFLVAKIKTDASLDSSFAQKGFVTLGNEGFLNFGFKVAEAPDSSIYMAGGSISMFATYTVARFIQRLEVTFPSAVSLPLEASLSNKMPSEALNNVLVFPNPIQEGATTVKVTLSQPQDMEFGLFDMQGKLLNILERRALPAGDNMIRLDLSNVHQKGAFLLRISSPYESRLIKVFIL